MQPVDRPHGDETGLDCGGDRCDQCGAGDGCLDPIDCQSGVCDADSAQCAAASCDDEIQNGDEEDVDCGGLRCTACGLDCPACREDEDCPEGSTCGEMGLCQRREEITIDWRTECAPGGALEVKVRDLPPGTYRVTALESGASYWDTSRWLYEITCANLLAPAVATPAGAVYPTAAQAFRHLVSTTQEVNFEGGDLICGAADQKCDDNHGSIAFRIDLVCPSCGDGIVSGDETDVDCGGTACGRCPDGADCGLPEDCRSEVCDPIDLECLAPSCEDGVQNGNETGADCGGSLCPACLSCQVCTSDDECPGGGCGIEGRCTRIETATIDWRADCGDPAPSVVKVESLPAGSYRVTALESAASVFNTGGWVYAITCENLSVTTVKTPDGASYDTPGGAFANLVATSEDVSFAGGDLLCGRQDSPCTDNHGSISFEMEHLCVPPEP